MTEPAKKKRRARPQLEIVLERVYDESDPDALVRVQAELVERSLRQEEEELRRSLEDEPKVIRLLRPRS